MSELIPVPPHLGGSYEQGDSNTIMPDVVYYLITKYDLHSVIDIGCGWGHTMQLFENFLVHTVGFDGDPNCIQGPICFGNKFLHDFTQGPPKCEALAPGLVYDLAWSAEFLEHVEAQYMQNYMDVFRRCRYACITHAEPGQPGHHHVLCENDDFWVEKFAENGFIFDPQETAILRRTDRWKAGWGRRTLMFFKRI